MVGRPNAGKPFPPAHLQKRTDSAYAALQTTPEEVPDETCQSGCSHGRLYLLDVAPRVYAEGQASMKLAGLLVDQSN